MRIKKNSLINYLKNYYKKDVTSLEISKIGSGWVATGFKAKFKLAGATKQLAIRTLNPINFSHDYVSDRAAYFLIQHHSSELLLNHIKSLGVIGINYKNESIQRIDENEEYFQILDWATGSEYILDLLKVSKKGATEKDLYRAKFLSTYLTKIHKKPKFKKDRAISMYKRHSRDLVGSAFLMDVLDTYPENPKFISKNEIISFVNDIYKYRESIKNNYKRVSKIHGDFHPGNIRFDQEKLIVLDAARHIWGEPADDVVSLTINYLWLSLNSQSNFSTDLKKLYKKFWENYIETTNDKSILKIAPLYFAIRCIVLTHPNFFDAENKTRRQLINLAKKYLKNGVLDFKI